MLVIFMGLSACSNQSIKEKPQTLLVHAKYLFDGYKFHKNTSVLIRDSKIEKVAARELFTLSDVSVVDLGDATLLPGFIELHAHINYRKVPEDLVLQHGITTIRDLAGPVHKPYGGNGKLRVLTAGPLLTAPHGYPIPSMGRSNSVIEIQSEQHARETVQQLAQHGAVVIKVALEPGGEIGAPWAAGHHHGHGHSQHKVQKQAHAKHKTAWPLLSASIVKAIVDEAHKQELKVTAHIGEERGAEIALTAGIDEWAHMPCSALPNDLLTQAVKQNVTIISTLDTLSKCSGIQHNTKTLAQLNAKLLYGAEIAHPDIPWGIDAQELMYLQQWANLSTVEALQATTSKSGEYLKIPLLGTLTPGAPADIISIKGNLHQGFKALEYPNFVMSGGKIIKQ